MVMAKITATTFLILLMLSYVLARPEPTFHDVTPMETHRGENETAQRADHVDEDSCKGLGEDECMMRRTLEAHLDYIYTQKHNKP